MITAFGVGSAAAQNDDYPPGAFSLSLSASVVTPGAPVTATASMCEVGVPIRVGVDGTSIQQQAPCQQIAGFAGIRRTETVRQAGAQVSTRASVTFNAPTTPGQYTVRATELGGQARSATARLTVTPDDALGGADVSVPETAGAASLPGTGIELANLLSVGAAAIVLGLGAVAVARRRRLDVGR